MMKQYTQKFYENRHSLTKYSSEKALTVLLESFPTINSACDVGCGVGTWLSVLRKKGIKDVKGFDGNWVDLKLLEIPVEMFQPVDLSEEIRAAPVRRYDLAISLEVAEHLPMEQARAFVSYLTRLSDTVLFSAAIPGQGGIEHLNEQWQSYWAMLFVEAGYAVADIIRPKLLKDRKILPQYRQNIIVYAKKDAPAFDALASVTPSASSADPSCKPLPLDLRLPELYGVKEGMSCFFRASETYVKRMFKRG